MRAEALELPQPLPLTMPRWQRILQSLYQIICSWVVRLYYRPEFSGFEKLPEHGPAILICNHVSYVDGLILQACVKRHVRFLVACQFYDLPVISHFMKVQHNIPIYPTREGVQHALSEVSSALRNGDLVCIFPEAKLTTTGSLGRFKPGIEWILQKDSVPVYPIATSGLWGSVFSKKYAHSLFPWWPRKLCRRVKVMCGDPITTTHPTRDQLQQIVLRLKYQMQE